MQESLARTDAPAPSAQRGRRLRAALWATARVFAALLVITAGVPFGTPGATNILRIAYV